LDLISYLLNLNYFLLEEIAFTVGKDSQNYKNLIFTSTIFVSVLIQYLFIKLQMFKILGLKILKQKQMRIDYIKFLKLCSLYTASAKEGYKRTDQLYCFSGLLLVAALWRHTTYYSSSQHNCAAAVGRIAASTCSLSSWRCRNKCMNVIICVTTGDRGKGVAEESWQRTDRKLRPGVKLIYNSPDIRCKHLITSTRLTVCSLGIQCCLRRCTCNP